MPDQPVFNVHAHVPKQTPYFISSTHILRSFFLISFEMALFFGYSFLTAAILSKRLNLSVIVGVALVLVLQASAQSLSMLGFKYIPPMSVKELSLELFVSSLTLKSSGLKAKLVLVPLIASLCMLLLSYLQFRRYEVS